MRSPESSHIGRSRASSRTLALVRAPRSVVLALLWAPYACASEGLATVAIDASAAADAADAADVADAVDAADAPPEDAAPDACAAGAGDWIGFVEEYTGSGYRLVHTPSGPLIVTRDDAGLYAYAGTCTFAACTLTVDSLSGVATCPCHGDAYDFDGLVLSAGPATAPLAHFALTICGRRVYVDQTRTVPHTVRTTP
jgi:Rieske Fe-S protein